MLRPGIILVCAVLVVGCGKREGPPGQAGGERPTVPRPPGLDPSLDLLKKYPAPVASTPPVVGSAAVSGRQLPAVLDAESLFVPAGWMGDAAEGGLEYRICTEEAYSPPSCEEWTYNPSRGTQGWAGVAYLWPPEGGWGDSPGRDLTGYTHLRFRARGKTPGIRVLVSSGGSTRPGSRHPASYTSTLGAITLGTDWGTYSVPIGPDTSNTSCALSLILTRQLCPDTGIFWIDNIVFVRE